MESQLSQQRSTKTSLSQHSLAQQASSLLLELEVALKSLALWQSQRPSEQALQSQQPFCFDTLAFEQWLQFVLIERFKWMIKQQKALPTDIAITPMAEEAFKHLGQEALKISSVLTKLDQLLTAKHRL